MNKGAINAQLGLSALVKCYKERDKIVPSHEYKPLNPQQNIPP